jgi:hypothetical protein
VLPLFEPIFEITNQVKMKRFFTCLLLSSLFLTSCNLGQDKIRGNGKIKNESRPVGSFNRISVQGNIEVYVRQDSVASVRVEADENLMQYILVKTEGEKLVIKPEDHTNISGTNDIKVYVSGPAFTGFDVSGASSIRSETLISGEAIEIDVTGASEAELEIKSPRVSADVTGASSVFLKGQTKDLDIESTGASQAKCFGLLSENADVDVTGASSAEVFASVSLKADASGASHIKYKGAATHTGGASGAGSISKVD